MYKKAVLATLLMLFALSISLIVTGCWHQENPVQNKQADIIALAILDFSVEKDITKEGEENRLHWKVQGADKLSISPKLGEIDEVTSQQSVTITTSQTRPYTLTASDKAGNQVTASVTVNVQAAPQKQHAWPIMFVSQVPLQTDLAARLSVFANHLTGMEQVPRGGDLMLRYPDGSLRNLTREAGFGTSGFQGSTAIAVREPAIHWNGEKAVFSMVIGAPEKPGETVETRWQLYEVRGLGKHQKATISKIAHQEANYNHVSPIYASDDSIIFTSDRPYRGLAHLYPQLDEYEATPSISGLWKLNPVSGELHLLSQTPSGAFTPIIDSFGRVLFTRWDHLQQDQLADRDRDAQSNGFALPFRSYNYQDESATAQKLSSRVENFPESRITTEGHYGKVNGFQSNSFTIWQINQDGSAEETLNHIGLHELAFNSLVSSFADDTNLKSQTAPALHANRLSMRREGGLFHLREDPRNPGSYYATYSRETGSYSTGHLVRLTASPAMNPEKITINAITETAGNDRLRGGRYRNPLPLSDGRIIASHTRDNLPLAEGWGLQELRLRFLQEDQQSGLYQTGKELTSGLYKSLNWWSGSKKKDYKGDLWELDPVEVRPHPQQDKRPERSTSSLEAPERAVLAEEGISEARLRTWLQDNELALIITRDQTSRDRADLQQPYNLQVPGGVRTVSRDYPEAKVYPISYFQLVEADMLRAYADRPGRRVLASPVKLHPIHQLTNSGYPAGSVKIASDGSTAAFVPAGRALSWQTTDEAGNPVVRERNWITFQKGEMRVCASCHGVNSLNQAGQHSPANKPLALRELLGLWKNQLK